MGDIAIRVEGLGKLYQLGARERYRTLRDTLTNTFTAPLRWFRSNGSNDAPETIWALKDVSFDVKHGEVLGIIGRNGAGKSTLLKILSRITEPTEGRAEILGRVGSLLEVGTGFHPELTGRENIYLNGAILGMKRAEIQHKFDEIVAFAEVEKFLDTPVKHYSSGMYVRLAFAVAAHMEPEILIVDEVLAVGDHQFQNKCLNRMSEASHSGRTVLFVSHSMPAIQRLCKRVLVLENGRVLRNAEPVSAVGEYLNAGVLGEYSAPSSSVDPKITSAAARLEGPSILLTVEFDSPFPLVPPMLGFIMYDQLGNPVFGTNTQVERPAVLPRSGTAGRFDVLVPADYFRPNRYLFSLWLGDGHSVYQVLEHVLQMELHGAFQSELTPQEHGSIVLPVEWRYSSSSV